MDINNFYFRMLIGADKEGKASQVCNIHSDKQFWINLLSLVQQ